MSFSSLLLMGIGVALDATAVAAARGISAAKVRPRDTLVVAGLFGGFQALMPALGWILGSRVGGVIQAWDHWLVFLMLSAIGAKMLWEARAPESVIQQVEGSPFDLRIMLLLAVATSIDALGLGITLPILKAPFVTSLATIGLTTAALSAVGLHAGRRFGAALGRRLNLAGGLVLIGLGVKILLDSLRAV